MLSRFFKSICRYKGKLIFILCGNELKPVEMLKEEERFKLLGVIAVDERRGLSLMAVQKFKNTPINTNKTLYRFIQSVHKSVFGTIS